MSTTLTLTRPAPATPPPAAQPPVGLGYHATVNVRGALRLPAAPSTGTATAMNQRTRTGTTHRIDLGDGIACWLDGDQQGGSGELNWVATQICTTLSGGTFRGPDDAPFVCGLALFTGTAGTGPTALSEAQLRRVVDAHAAASVDEPEDASQRDARSDMTRSPLVLA